MPGLSGHSPTDSSGPKQLKLGQLELEQLDLVDDHIWHQKLEKHWSPGEATAADRLDRFIDEALTNYHTDRNIPALDGTSGLSPHLHFGEISPQQIVSALAPLIECQGGSIGSAAEGFLRQLIWREFARYILWHFPETSTESMNRKFTKSFWSHHTVNLKKWQQGKTGIPIIDAGMKQLWATGTMHNRVRMLVASLLTKNMGIAWQEGARWFWDTLVDADLANNSMGWQWVAGCGVDAAPYFRIFNPDTQAQRFDEQGVYVDRWLKITSSTSQTRPVVDLAISRSRALDRYNSMISKPYTSQQDQAQEKP
jgi:deoxyribodipyrimidine photo-lyase